MVATSLKFTGLIEYSTQINNKPIQIGYQFQLKAASSMARRRFTRDSRMNPCSNSGM
jgi:hypothetical protein